MSQENLFELKQSTKAHDRILKDDRALQDNSEKASFQRHEEESGAVLAPDVECELQTLKEEHQRHDLERSFLHYAVANGSLSSVSRFLRSSYSLLDECTTRQGKTVLHVAAERQLPGMISLLLLSGVEDKDAALELSQKVEANATTNATLSDDLIELWKKEIDKINENKTIFDGQIGTELLGAQVSVEEHTPFSTAALCGSVASLQLMFNWAIKFGLNNQKTLDNIIHCADNERSSLLHLAVKSGDVETVTYLCTCSFVNAITDQRTEVDVNAKDASGKTALMIGAEADCCDAIDALMKLSHTNVEVINNAQRTVLHCAVENTRALETLLKHQTQMKKILNKGDQNGCTPLHLAAEEGFNKSIVELLDKQANANARNKEEDTPLHLSSRKSWLRSSQQLMKHCDVNAVNCKGQTPLHEAAKSCSYAIAKALLDNGAKSQKQKFPKALLHRFNKQTF